MAARLGSCMIVISGVNFERKIIGWVWKDYLVRAKGMECARLGRARLAIEDSDNLKTFSINQWADGRH